MSKMSYKLIFKGTEIICIIKAMQSFIVMNISNIEIGTHHRGHSHLHQCDVITKELKGHNIRKELANDQVQWQRVIKSREIQM